MNRSPPPVAADSAKLLMPVFVASGAAGLIYQIAWLRELTSFLGSSTVAVTIILTAFMGGLGAGGWLLGRLADRLTVDRLLLGYVALETFIGLYALQLPLLLHAAETGYVWLFTTGVVDDDSQNAVRMVVALALLSAPTAAMGGTLPVIGRFLALTGREVAGTAANLYAWNTLGAMLGTVLAGYVLLPQMGVRVTTWVAVGLNFLVAAAVLVVGRRMVSPPPPPTVRQTAGKRRRTTARPASLAPELRVAVLVAYGISGMAAMFYEVAWTRTLIMVLGTTVYAFTTMLATFLLGIGLGSLLFRHLPARLRTVTAFVLFQLVLAGLVLATTPLLDRMPLAFLFLRELGLDGWLGTQAVRFMLTSAVMLGPTVLMGVMFPFALALLTDGRASEGTHIGEVYAANTIGGVVGASLAGLVLIPGIGMQSTIVAGALLNALAAALITVARFDRRGRVRWAQAVAMIAAVPAAAAATRPWAPLLLSSGVYVYGDNYIQAGQRYQAAADTLPEVPQADRAAVWEAAMRNYDLLYYDEGMVATVAVMQDRAGVRSLLINGKVDASVRGERDMNTQVMLGALPPLLHPAPGRALVVGLGSGVTAGAALRHPEIEHLVTAEISPKVVEAAHLFGEFNFGALQDPRMRIVPRDARNVLLTAAAGFDVIISQPSNPWIRGESSLFSLEWYRLVRDRLNAGGVFAQWVPAYHISRRNMYTIVRTLREVFPNLSLWSTGSPGDVLIIAFRDNPRVDRAQAQRRLEGPRLAPVMASLGLPPNSLLADLFLMDEEGLDAILHGFGQQVPLNTDDLLLTEFKTPFDMAEGRQVDRFAVEMLHAAPGALDRFLERPTPPAHRQDFP